MSSSPLPARGEVWLIDLDPTVGHETGRRRPCIVVSSNLLNQGQAGLAVVVPLTTRERGIPFHVPVEPLVGGLRQRSVAKCEEVRSVSVERFVARWGMVDNATLRLVADRLSVVLHL